MMMASHPMRGWHFCTKSPMRRKLRERRKHEAIREILEEMLHEQRHHGH
jgi:hypothetical protein